jgi:hypothetical protein
VPDARQTLDAFEARHTPEELIIPAMQLAFARLHKAAFGVATGVAGAVLMGAMTMACLLVPRAGTFPLGLLGEYFAGFDSGWVGASWCASWRAGSSRSAATSPSPSRLS